MSEAKYWEDIRDFAGVIVNESARAALDGDPSFDMHDRIHEFTDASHWVIYYSDAHKVMQYTANREAYEDGGPLPGGKTWDGLACYCAFWAMRQDITDAVCELTSERDTEAEEA